MRTLRAMIATAEGYQMMKTVCIPGLLIKRLMPLSRRLPLHFLQPFLHSHPMLPVPSNIAHILLLLIGDILRIFLQYTCLDLAQLDLSNDIR